jgi:hypothetical protein
MCIASRTPESRRSSTGIAADVLGMDEARARADMEEVWQPKGVWAEFVKRY